MTTRRFLAPLALTLTAALALSACGGSDGGSDDGGTTAAGADGTTAASGRGGTLTLGILQEPPSWDPAQTHVGHRLQPYQAVYDSLALREPDGTLAPMLATEWGYTDDTNTVMSLDLRTDVTFSDGAAFDAEAVVANIEHFKTGERSPVRHGREHRPGGRRRRGHGRDHPLLARPGAGVLPQPGPRPDGQPGGARHGRDGPVPVGSGPYVMVADQTVVGSQAVFEAREDYWNADLQKWDRIEMKLLADVTSASTPSSPVRWTRPSWTAP